MILAMVGTTVSTTGSAQTRSVRDTATAYGARLDAAGEPADLNRNRIDDRIDSRIANRIELRIERYRPGNSNDPAAVFEGRPDDKTRIDPVASSTPRQFER